VLPPRSQHDSRDATISGGLPLLQCVQAQFGRTSPLAISTAASASSRVGVEETAGLQREGGETAYVRYPGCRHGHVTNPLRQRGAVSAHTDRSPSPFLFIRGWGASELALRPAVATGTTGLETRHELSLHCPGPSAKVGTAAGAATRQR
jgi:hypothetical protein